VAAVVGSAGLSFPAFSAVLWIAAAGCVPLALTGYPEPLPGRITRYLIGVMFSLCLRR
jgi:hypothetical protein